MGDTLARAGAVVALLDLTVVVSAAVALVAYGCASHEVRRPGRLPWASRWAGGLTVLAVLLYLTGVGLRVLSGASTAWSGRPAVLAAVPVLLAVAAQWLAPAYRALLVVVGVLLVVVLAQVGRRDVLDDRLQQARADVVELDRRLADAGVRTIDQIRSAIEEAVGRVDQELGRVAAVPTEPVEVRNAVVARADAATQAVPIDAASGSAGATAELIQAALATIPQADQYAALRTALVQYQDLVSAQPVDLQLQVDADEAQRAVGAACRATGRQLEPAAGTAGQQEVQGCTHPPPAPDAGSTSSSPGAGGSSNTAPTAVAGYESAVAEARLQVAQVELVAGDADGRDARTAARDEAAAALAQSRTRDAVLGVGAPVGEVEAVSQGAAVLLAVGRGAPVSLSLLGWLAVAAAIVWLLRRMEIRNGRLDVGPVEFDASVGAGSPLRRAVLLSIPEPGVQPGSVGTTVVTALTTVEGTGTAGKVVSALLTVAQTVGIPPRGYAVSLAELGAATTAPAVPAASVSGAATSGGATEPPAPPVRSVVTITERRTKRRVAVLRARNLPPDEALAELGHRAAQVILSRAQSVPPWMRWSDGTAGAALRFDRLTDGGTGAGADRLAGMEEVARSAPGNAQVLLAFGYELELRGRPRDAQRAYRRARALWDDYPLAQYRLAISCSNLLRDELSADRTFNDGEQGKKLFRALAAELGPLRWLRRFVSLREWSALPPWRQRKDALLAIRIAEALFYWRNEKCKDKLPHDQRLAAEKSRSAVVQYNLACLDAAFNQSDKAIMALDRMLGCPDVARISPEWLSKDPDLDEVRRRDDFARIAGALAPVGEPA